MPAFELNAMRSVKVDVERRCLWRYTPSDLIMPMVASPKPSFLAYTVR